MDYASSYAVGIPQHGIGANGARPSTSAAAAVLAAPKPDKLHWSTLVMIAGMAICFLGLMATIAGVPASMGYDPDGAPHRNKPTSNDPLKITQSLDGNMKWIRASSSDKDGSYVGYIKSINRSEAAIPSMVTALVTMDAAVRDIDQGIGEVGATTTAMGADMAAMLSISSASSATMTSLGGDIGYLSRSMLSLAGSTKQLSERMAAIEKQAAAIAAHGTNTALASTADLNTALPPQVPTPIYSTGQAVGAGANAAPGDIHAVSSMPPAIGAQPGKPGGAG